MGLGQGFKKQKVRYHKDILRTQQSIFEPPYPTILYEPTIVLDSIFTQTNMEMDKGQILNFGPSTYINSKSFIQQFFFNFPFNIFLSFAAFFFHLFFLSRHSLLICFFFFSTPHLSFIVTPYTIYHALLNPQDKGRDFLY